MAAAWAGSRQASVTSWPRSRTSRANAVPHDPHPTTTTFTSRFLPKVDRDGDALELEAVAQLVLDPVRVVARDESRVVDEHADAWRAARDLRPVEHVQPAPSAAGRLARLAQDGERLVQLGRRDSRAVLLELRLDPVEQALDAAAALRGDGEDRRPLAQAPVEMPAHLLQLDRPDVPLRDHRDRRARGLAGHIRNREVLLDHALASVHEHERDVRALRRLERAQLRVVLDALPLAALPPHPGRVHEHERPLAARVDRVDGVARRPRHLRDDDPLLAEDRVQQARLADVRAAENGD